MTFERCLQASAIAAVAGIFCDEVHGQGSGLQVTIDTRFLTVNDNFFERIGVDFDLTSANPSGVVSVVSNDPDEPIEEEVVDLRAKFANQETFLPEFGGDLGMKFADPNSRVPMSEVSVSGGMGITMPGGESGEMVAQAAVAIEVDVPSGLTGSIVFETEVAFTANIVEPLTGEVGFNNFVELVTDLDAFRFSGPEQRFNWSNNSLGPFGDMFNAITDFSLIAGVLVFDGANTIQHEIPIEEIIDGGLYYNTVAGVSLANDGTALAQINATGSFSYTLRAVTPSVTFRFAEPIPEPASSWLFAAGVLGLGLARYFRRG